MNELKLKAVANGSDYLSKEEGAELARFILALNTQKPSLLVTVTKPRENVVITSTEHLVEFESGKHFLYKTPFLINGYQVVPKSLSKEMIEAAQKIDDRFQSLKYNEIYSAMLDAASLCFVGYEKENIVI